MAKSLRIADDLFQSYDISNTLSVGQYLPFNGDSYPWDVQAFETIGLLLQVNHYYFIPSPEVGPTAS